MSGITFQGEKLSTCLEEMKSSLLQAHWEELAIDQDKVPLNPDYATYFAAEERGELYVVTIRNNDELIGYFIGFVRPGLHYMDCLTCTMDILYLKPEYRKSGVGYSFLQYLERGLKSIGVQRMYMGSKLSHELSKLYESLGFAKVEVYHSKYIGE